MIEFSANLTDRQTLKEAVLSKLENLIPNYDELLPNPLYVFGLSAERSADVMFSSRIFSINPLAVNLIKAFPLVSFLIDDQGEINIHRTHWIGIKAGVRNRRLLAARNIIILSYLSHNHLITF